MGFLGEHFLVAKSRPQLLGDMWRNRVQHDQEVVHASPEKLPVLGRQVALNSIPELLGLLQEQDQVILCHLKLESIVSFLDLADRDAETPRELLARIGRNIPVKLRPLVLSHRRHNFKRCAPNSAEETP